jgi:hypothetical protein
MRRCYTRKTEITIQIGSHMILELPLPAVS